ncbi:hypothetical protein ACIRPP_24735 [Streptomyces sp. NPDC101219]|uniref:hypothetical protein n=1 Tax=Streptomyces sp. NPDC101219 TaxID=3366131 RepID=UPI0037FFE3A9
MVAKQLPDSVREFTDYLHALVARLDGSGGWWAVFRQRDPDGMRACLDGRELPPWDVLQALLQDVAAVHGVAAADAETHRARTLYAAARAAHDARPGARDALSDRLDVTLRERRYAAERRARLNLRLTRAATPEEAGPLRAGLAWAHDDHTRATARCAELRARLAALDDRAPRPEPGAAGPAAPGAPAPPHSPPPAPPPKPRRGGARFAGAGEEGSAARAVPPGALPQLAPHAPAPGRGPRGARFAGAAEEAPAGQGPPGSTPAPQPSAADREAVAHTARLLARRRAEGRSGAAHALLAEAAQWPAVRFPLLAAGLRAAGLEADWTTLLWEAASLPLGRLAAVAGALTAAGLAEDAREVLRQGVVRPAEAVAREVLGLAADGRHHDVRALLDAYVRMRTPQEAARSAALDPPRLVPLLLAAARGVSDERHWDVLHALRVAGATA